MTLSICYASSLMFPLPSPPLLQAFNKHLLDGFLFANLLTGLVNMLLPTTAASYAFGVTVLLLYMGAVCAFVASGFPSQIRQQLKRLARM